MFKTHIDNYSSKENQEYLLEYMLKNMPQKIVSKLIMKRKVLNDGMVRKIHRL